MTTRRSRHLRFTFHVSLLVSVAPAFGAANVHAPNLRLYVSQRTFPPSKPAAVSLSTYNLRTVALSVHAVDIETLVPNATILEGSDDRRNPRSVRGRIARMRLGPALRSWSATVKNFYPNSWAEQRMKLPKLPSGVYVLRASGGGVETRTWLAISMRALVVKRSPDVVKAWLVNGTTGQPVHGASLVLYDAKGRNQSAMTGKDGLAHFKSPTEYGPLWVASLGGEPAFARASSPEYEKPYAAYVYTDRPVYRPGHLVRFRGTVRAVRRGLYSLPKARTVQVQIKTRGDTRVYDEELPLSDWGTFAGEFQLAPEPPLGSYSLEVALGDFREYASFEVEAYRKPEFDVTVAIPMRHYLGGKPVPVTVSAKYYFGSPVSGAKVNYSVQFEQIGEAVPERILTAAGLGSGALGRIEESFTGQGRLDAQGKLELSIPTRSLPFDRQMRVKAEVTELALRPRSGGDSALLTAAQFRLSVKPAKDQYQPGQTVEVEVRGTDYDDKPVATPTNVVLIEHLTDREGRAYEKRIEHPVTTDKNGLGTTSFKVVRPGEYTLECWARDGEGNAVYAASAVYVTKEKRLPEWPTLELSSDTGSYKPGDTAVLEIRTSLAGAWALMTLEGERLYRCEVRQLRTKDILVKLPVLPDYKPQVTARITVVQKGDLVSARRELSVPADDKSLIVLLAPDREAYEPGQTATYDLTTRDSRGRGVSAEVGLGVVDAALYAIRQDTTIDPMTFFWSGAREGRVQTDFSLAATYPGGGYQRMPAKEGAPPPPPGAPEAGEAIRVRRFFVDTAYWNPSVITDEDGHGRITFRVPDNLTTWRGTARGLTKETQAGETRGDVKVTLPLLVRLTLPRFYVQNDEATAAAIVHNYTGVERQVKVTLTAEGAQVLAAAEQTITLPAEGIKRLAWPVRISAAGLSSPASDRARFLVSADGGEGARDAMESTLPILPDGVRRVDAAAGMTDGSANVSLALPDFAVAGKSSLELALSPSLAGPIFEALDYLVGYPHGCAEQTMDSFLPNIIVTEVLKGLGAALPSAVGAEPKMLKRYVSFGLQKLLRYQHQDGGWHWWEFDASDPFITAYIVYGLAMARDAGYPLAAGPLPRGVDYLRRALAREQDRTAACYLLWAMAYANVWDANSLKAAVAVAERLKAERDKLDTFSRASFSLALDRLSQVTKPPIDTSKDAQTIAAELEAAAVVTGTAVHWTANATGSGSWLDSDIEVTAQVLQALLALKPDSEKIVPAVRWLMAARHGKEWNSTKDTAAAVLALTAYLKRAKELKPEATLEVRLGERVLRTVTFTQAHVFAEPVRVSIPAADLKLGENVVRLEKTGPGNLYWTAHLSYLIPAERAVPLARGIELRRRYRVAAEDPVTAGNQPAGSVIEVTTDVVSDSNYRYCVLEEPVPAGCEVIVGEEDRDPDVGCQRREVWDDRLVFYFDYLSKGERTLTYYLRSEAPGQYRIRPSVASLMYFPEVRGEGRLVRLKVTEE